MRAAEWREVDFDQLAAVSGASALFAYESGEFMPKYANLSIGIDERIAEATGFGYEWVDFRGVDGAWELIKESVDSDRSVKGWDWENILSAGYQDALEPEGRRIYAMVDGPDTYSRWWTWEEFGEYVTRKALEHERTALAVLKAMLGERTTAPGEMPWRTVT